MPEAALRTEPAYQALEDERDKLSAISLSSLLSDPTRFECFSRQQHDVVLDFSRNLITEDTLGLLMGLAERRALEAWRDRLFGGQPVNHTEGRAALHMALRAPQDSEWLVSGIDVMPEVVAERERMLSLASSIRDGSLAGVSGSFTDVVNIGIGGSDLGLVMVNEALSASAGDGGPSVHFVSNIDGCALADLLQRLDPGRTLFVVCSKSFSTLETQLNAEQAREWVVRSLGREACGRHFVAISTNDLAMDDFGIAKDLRLRLWDWVGGRYSLWSSVGLAIAVGIGTDAFRELLAGAATMDDHFCRAEFADNWPVLLGLIGIWNQNFLGSTSHIVLPYTERLASLPAYLQQLDMESNGKSVDRSGSTVDFPTGCPLWGGSGSNAQHSFFQLLHQGTAKFSMDFVAPVKSTGAPPNQQLHSLANMLAQADVFAHGYSEAQAIADLTESGLAADVAKQMAPHRVHAGGRPSNVLLMRHLNPHNLGFLLAMYEHKVFVQSVVWGINPFDQWGVQLGKQVASETHRALSRGHGTASLPGIAAIIRDWGTA